MKRNRQTPEQIIRKLREADALLASGAGLEEICRGFGIGQSTYHRWRAQYGGMTASDAKRLRELEKENDRSKRLVAEQALDNQILREVAKGNF
jgi:putative transposase